MRVLFNSNKQGSDVEELSSFEIWQRNIPRSFQCIFFLPCLRCLSEALHCVPRILKVLGKSVGLCKTTKRKNQLYQFYISLTSFCMENHL